MNRNETEWAMMAGMGTTFYLHDPRVRDVVEGGKPVKNEDTSKARKERKERARMLTAQRMAEIQAQGGTRKRKKKRK